jgi:hypothetical protein
MLVFFVFLYQTKPSAEIGCFYPYRKQNIGTGSCNLCMPHSKGSDLQWTNP